MKNVPFILVLVVISEHSAFFFLCLFIMFSDFKVRKCIQFSLIFKPFPPPVLTFALGEHLSFEGMGLPPPQKGGIWFFPSELEEHFYEEFLCWRI